MNALLTPEQFTAELKTAVESLLAAAVADAVRFYDHLRVYEYDPHSEQGARVQAEFYLRRKVPGLTQDGAAVILANALALRAAARVNP